MKLTVDAQNFVEAISWVTKSYDAKDDKAYVALIVNENGEGYLSHANPTSYMRSRSLSVLDIDFDGDTDSRAELALEGKFLQRLSAALGAAKGPIVLTKALDKSRAALDLTSPSGKFTIPLVDAKIAHAPSMVSLGEVDDNEYFDSLQRLAKLCDAVNAGYLPVIGTVDIKLNSEDNTVTMMATDRYALGEIVVPFIADSEAGELLDSVENFLLPHDSAMLVAPSKGLSTLITLVYESEGKKFGYSFADGRIALFSLSNAVPLAYESLKTNASANIPNTVKVSTSDLKKAIGIVSSLAWEEDSVWLDISSEGKLVVSDAHRSNTFEVATNEASVDADYRVKFIRPVINEAFSPVSTGDMKLMWSTERKAFVLVPVLDDGTNVTNVFVLALPSDD